MVRVSLIVRVAALASYPAVVKPFATTGPPTTKTTTPRPRSQQSRLFSQSDRPPNTFNPFRMVGDVASSLLTSSTISMEAKKPSVDNAISSISSLESWSQIRSNLESQMVTDEERKFRSNLAMGYGAASPLHKIRLYDESNKEKDIRVTFYRDSASWCPYCQKVWLMLEEKKIPYRVEKINMRCYGDKPASFFRIQPGGQIPVAEIDGRVYGQSNDIMFALEELFAPANGHKSLSPGPGQQARARDLLRLERELFSAWMYWLTGGGTRSKNNFIEVLTRVEQSLQKTGPFFMGKDVSLVDFMFASFLERMAASLLYFKGFFIRVAPGEATEFPAVNKWFDAMETLESYQLSKSDYYTHCWDLPPQLGGCVYEAGCEPYEKAINGERSLDGTQASWELPLQPHNGGIEPDWTWAAVDDAMAKREAVERVTGNYEAIARFACRGAGRKGVPPVSAPLADPNAVPNEAVETAVDACMRTVCQQLLLDETDAETMSQVGKTIVEEGGKEYAGAVIDSLAYVRDRIGVPRDMKLPAARQLRAHLNWAIKILSDVAEDSK